MENENLPECRNWLDTATQEDMKLYEAVIGYEYEYFKDMTFQEESIIKDFFHMIVTCENEIVDSPYIDRLQRLDSLSNLPLRCYVRKIPRGYGVFDRKELTIEIDPEYATNKPTILHEMIHAYEYALSKVPNFYREILFVCLYRDLQTKVECLHKRVIKHSHVWEAEGIRSYAGEHGILFFLKSIDLDLRCGYKLGTVCSYDRDKD